MMRSFPKDNPARLVVQAPKDSLTNAPVTSIIGGVAHVYDKETGAVIVEDLPVTLQSGRLVATVPAAIAETLEVNQIIEAYIEVDVTALIRLVKDFDARVVRNDS
jgi:hypothetical protein